MTHLGAVRTLPNHHVIELAKAAREADGRYLTDSLGPEGTRVNVISAGPIRTQAASGSSGLRGMPAQGERRCCCAAMSPSTR